MGTRVNKFHHRCLSGEFSHPFLVRLRRARFAGFLLALVLTVIAANVAGCGGGTSATPPAPAAPLALPQAAALSSSCTAATAGSSYSCPITVSGGKAPFTWSVTGLPKGLTTSVSADTTTLTISGTPQAQAAIAAPRAFLRSAATPDVSIAASVRITVTDSAANSATLSFTITLTNSALAITTTSPLPGGTAGAAYSAMVTATGGFSPYTWTISGLPTGLNSASGSPSATISGTTDQVGTFMVTAMVSDSESTPATASITLSLTIAQAATLMVSTTTLPNGTVNVAYSQTLAATGGVSPITWTLSSGALPTGLSLSTAGVISGTATATGTFSFTVNATDAESPAQSATQALSLTINTASTGLSITTSSPLPSATLSSAYSTMVTATGGTPPYSWALAASSALPAGLTLTSASPSATISGTPTATGTFQFTLNVTDSAGTPATASASFLITVTGSSTLNCPATVNLTLCGIYVFGLRGFNSSGGPVAFGGVFTADNAGHVVSGSERSNDSVAGVVTLTITGGSYVMDSSGDGRGVLTLISSNASVAVFRFVLESAANAGIDSIEEFDSTGVLASGVIGGPETAPIPQLPANAPLALAMEGINAAGQRSALLGNFVIGAAGCDGSSGSFSSQSGESVVTNTAGTTNTALTATGSCAAADANTGIGTAQITISGGTPFTNATLQFTYVVVGSAGSGAQGAILLETDAIAANQPILSGLASGVQPPSGGFNAASLGCPCLFVAQGTTNGSASSGHDVASIVQILTTAGTGSSGTLSGVLDQNAGGTITLQGAWPYSSYSVDSNGVGTITGTGSPTVHFVASGGGGNGFTFQTLDESAVVQVGTFRQQNSVSIESPGLPYIMGRDLGVLGVTRDTAHVLGILIPSGATSGTMSGTLDAISSSGSSAGAAATGSYASISSTTGRGTGTMNLTAGSASVPVVIYARRHRQFVVLDVQSTTPYIIGARLQ